MRSGEKIQGRAVGRAWAASSEARSLPYTVMPSAAGTRQTGVLSRIVVEAETYSLWEEHPPSNTFQIPLP